MENIHHKGRSQGNLLITYNGKVVSHHPISNTRLENILKAEKAY